MDEISSGVPQIVDQDQVVPTDWCDVAKQIISLKDISQGPEKLELFRKHENLFQEAIEDRTQLYSVLLAFRGLGEPRYLDEVEKADPNLEQIRKFKTKFIVRNLGVIENYMSSSGDYHASANTKIGRHLQGIKSLFIDIPTVILVSCSTGQLGGIGHEISALGAKVIAPDDITSLDSISVFRNEFGALEFRVEFDESHANTFERGAFKR